MRLLKSCRKSGRHQTRPLRCTKGWWIRQKWQLLRKIKNDQHLGGAGGRLCAAMWRAQLQKSTGVARPFCPFWTTSSPSLRAASRGCRLLLFKDSCCFLDLNDEKEAEIRSRFAADLPEPNTFQEELKRYRKKWEIQALANVSLPSNINDALLEANTLSFPNIQRVLTILLVAPVTTATVERSNSALGYIKTKLRSTMGQQRLNDLILLFVHKDIPLDMEAVIDRFARMKLRRMALTNALTATDAV